MVGVCAGKILELVLQQDQEYNMREPITGKRNSCTNTWSPPQDFMGEKITGTNEFCLFVSGKSHSLGGPNILKKCPPAGTGTKI